MIERLHLVDSTTSALAGTRVKNRFWSYLLIYVRLPVVNLWEQKAGGNQFSETGFGILEPNTVYTKKSWIKSKNVLQANFRLHVNLLFYLFLTLLSNF